MKTLRLIGISLALVLVGSMDAQRTMKKRAATNKPITCEELKNMFWEGPAKNPKTGMFDHEEHALSTIIGDVQYNGDKNEIDSWWLQNSGNPLVRGKVVMVPVSSPKEGRNVVHKLAVVLGESKKGSQWIDVQVSSCKQIDPQHFTKVVERRRIYEYLPEKAASSDDETFIDEEETYGG